MTNIKMTNESETFTPDRQFSSRYEHDGSSENHRESRTGTKSKLVVRDSAHKSHRISPPKPSEVHSGSSLDSTTRISVILDDHLQSTIDSSTCEDPNCTRTRFLSLRSRQSLLERINILENKLNQQHQYQRTLARTISTNNKESMDREMSLVEQKERRIHDLERLVEDQRKLRLQDARQVEEKAAKIKEWVANKLKELEDQNKKLKEQNKRQKEQVDNLNNKLAILSPLVTRKFQGRCEAIKTLENKALISNKNEIFTFVDSNRSISTKRRHMKNSFRAVSSSSNSDNDQDSVTPRRHNFEASDLSVTKSSIHQPKSNTAKINPGMTLPAKIKRESSTKPHDHTIATTRRNQKGSPVYDSVTLEPKRNLAEIAENRTKLTNNDLPEVSQRRNKYGDPNVYDAPHIERHYDEDNPPPPPLHQSDRWEQALYQLAQDTCAQIKAQHLDGSSKYSSTQNLSKEHESTRHSLESELSNCNQQPDCSNKNNLLAVIRPTFTNILGEQMNENFILDSDSDIFLELSNSGSAPIESSNHHTSNDNSSSRSSQHVPISQYKSHCYDTADQYDVPSLEYSSMQLDSPIRSKNNHREIIRTQSIRKPPIIENLFDIISTDLMKRGYLIKPGAIKNHRRWYVLKNFHLYCYKNENEEMTKSNPDLKFKLTPDCKITAGVSMGDNNYPFKISSQGKVYQLIAESPDVRDEWLKIIGVALSMSDLNPETLVRSRSSHEGMVSMIRQGYTKKCYASLVDHVLFFLKSNNEPIPIGYLPLKESRVREISSGLESYDDESYTTGSNQDGFNHECSLAIYPKFAKNCDPTYLTLADQQDVDKWFFHLAKASCSDQSSGTPYERSLFKIMMKRSSEQFDSLYSSDEDNDQITCKWADYATLAYVDKPVSQPLTTLPNESSKLNAIELFKSIQLFTQVPLNPIGIDYHVCLLQNCLKKYLDNPELRNEFYAQIIKQTTYIRHNCGLLSPVKNTRTNLTCINEHSDSRDKCHIEINPNNLDNVAKDKHSSRSASLSEDYRKKSSTNDYDMSNEKQRCAPVPSSSKEIVQAFQILAATLSLTLPTGRIRWWLENHLATFSNETNFLGKYAKYCRQAFERTLINGPREMIPSRTEILGLILRNPYDHSHPHSIPVNFMDDSYILVGADGSTTVEEFMSSLCSQTDIRISRLSDFYLFSDDPLDGDVLHILEPQRKLMDVVGWWEHTFRREHSGRFENTRVIKLVCKKRLPLIKSTHETDREKLLIVHQINYEILNGRLPVTDALAYELGALMLQIELRDYRVHQDEGNLEEKLYASISKYTPPGIRLRPQNVSNGSKAYDNSNGYGAKPAAIELSSRWQVLEGRTPSDCTRIYLNCVRRLSV